MEDLQVVHVQSKDYGLKSHGREQTQAWGLTPAQRKDLSPKELTTAVIQALCEVSKETEEPEFQGFMNDVVSALEQSRRPLHKPAPIVESLCHSFIERGPLGLSTQIKYAFHGFLASQRFSKSNLQDQARIADIRYPVEWYPTTRQMQRTIHLHVGPTNSGKTYHALKRLEEAGSGLYAGPLRLLAHEVYTRLNARGKPCNLITGDERQYVDADKIKMSSCTVEMVNVSQDLDVAVVDEIQMIGHEERGWAWTHAVLGLKAKELHLCGEERTVPLIRELAAAMGDDLRVHHYQRLSPLKTMSTSLKGDLSSLRKGDCLVAFSKLMLHKLKHQIELRTGKPVAIIYGSLPPEVRAQQARLFNDPNNDHDILVASDAIGMGLNLSIKRIIFTDTSKYNGRDQVPIEISQIKQLAGRAGRYRTAAQATDKETYVDELGGPEAKITQVSPAAPSAQTLGLVTTLERRDLSVVQRAMESQADPIMSAGLFPPNDVIMKFAAYFPPSTPYSYILLRLHNTSVLHPRFHLCDLKDALKIADAIEPVKNLTISDRIIFCASPASVKDEALRPILRSFAECVANQRGGEILDIKALDLEILNVRPTIESRTLLLQLECLHKALILYLWLSYRFAGVFSSHTMAFYIKGIVEERIQQNLTKAATILKSKENPSTKSTSRNLLESNSDEVDNHLLGNEQSIDPSHEQYREPSKRLEGNSVIHQTLGRPGAGVDVTIANHTPGREAFSRGDASC